MKHTILIHYENWFARYRIIMVGNIKNVGVQMTKYTPICTPIADYFMPNYTMLCQIKAFYECIEKPVKSRYAPLCEVIQSYDKSTFYLPWQGINKVATDLDFTAFL